MFPRRIACLSACVMPALCLTVAFVTLATLAPVLAQTDDPPTPALPRPQAPPRLPAQPQVWMPTPRDLQVPYDRIDNPAISPDGQTVAFSALDSNDRSHLFVMPAEGGNPTPLTSGPSDERTPRFSSDGRNLAFVSDRSGNADIWTMPVAGGAPRQITTDPADDLDPEWSPDGQRLAFTSNRTGALLIYMVAATGGQVFPISAGTGPDRRPAWSPDGNTLAFESRRDGETHIWTIPAYGGEAKRLTRQTEPEWAPSWSADSRRVRAFGTRGKSVIMLNAPFVQGGQSVHSDHSDHGDHSQQGDAAEPPRLFGLRVDGNPAMQPPALTRNGDRITMLNAGGSGIGLLNFVKTGGSGQRVTETGGINREPAWSTDGRRIVFVSDRGGRRDLYVSGISTGRMVRLTDDEARESGPDWSAAGDIAFAVEAPTGSEIWILEPETTKRMKVVAEPGRNRQPAWSPDGKLIAYVSDTAGSDDLWVAQVSDGKKRRLTTLPGGETNPAWSPDGQWITFTRETAGTSEIWKIPSAGGDPVRVAGPPTDSSSCLQPDWNSKNAWIVFSCQIDGGSALFMAPPDGGKAVQLYRPPNLRLLHPAWSPDASYVAYEWSKPDHLVVIDLPSE